MTLRETYDNLNPCGCYSITNTFGYIFFAPIFEDRDYDYIVADYIVDPWTGNGWTNFRRATVKYADSGRAYINRHNKRIYLDEVLAI